MLFAPLNQYTRYEITEITRAVKNSGVAGVASIINLLLFSFVFKFWFVL